MLALLSQQALSGRCELTGEELLVRPLAGAGPTPVYVHTYTNDIVAIRDADQSFSADVFLRVEWRDPRLAHGGSAPCSVELTDIWWPELQVMNRRTIQNARTPEPLVAADGTVSLLLRGFGDFSFDADLSNFPFDTQRLQLDIMSIYGDEEIDFVYDPARITLSPKLSVPNFTVQVAGIEERADHVASTQRKHARLLISMDAVRLTGFYTWQQFVPLLLVVLMAWIVFWIPREHVPSRIGLAATSMLTLIAYRFAMSSVLPPIAYLTRFDKFIIGASILVFLSLCTAVAVTYTMDRVSEPLADSINTTARIATPLLLILLAVFTFFA
jgi:gmma-aminobutyric acid receptor subunit gamma